jgi:hypothetical protein
MIVLIFGGRVVDIYNSFFPAASAVAALVKGISVREVYGRFLIGQRRDASLRPLAQQTRPTQTSFSPYKYSLLSRGLRL